MDEAITMGTQVELVAGLDLSDRWMRLAIVEMVTGRCVEEGRLAVTQTALAQRFAKAGPLRLVLEVGTH